MAIETAALSAFAFPHSVQPGDDFLPHADGIQVELVRFCDIPIDALPTGFIAFTYATSHDQESSIDIQFSLASGGFSWTLRTNRVEFASMHWAVGLSPGKPNHFIFNLDKGGTIPEEPGFTFGGAGRVHIQNIVVFYQRSSVQEHWKWCHKCQGLFFKDNPGSACPKGGSHDDSGSGNYGLILK